MKRIVVSGVGGQSVKLISHTLALALQMVGYHLSLVFDYDSAIRGGKIIGHLTYDHEPIDNPMIDDADILLKLASKDEGIVAERTVCETGLCHDEEIPFGRLGVEHFGKAIFGNMIALGHLLRLIDLDPDQIDLPHLLSTGFVEKNVEAVQLGYDLNTWED